MKPDDIRYSIIVPVYNRPDEIKELLESLSLQTYKAFELVIVEDGSTLKSDSIVAGYQEQLNVHYFFKENTGPGISRNYGVEKASGNYFIFLDSDCIIPSGYMEAVHRFLSQHYVDAFGGPDRADASFTQLQKAINYSMTSFFTTGGIRGNKKRVDKFYPRSFNMGFSDEVFQKTKGFPVTRLHPGEDMILSIEIIQNGFSTALIDQAHVYHKRRTSIKRFYIQVYKFGFVRYVISLLYPNTFKVFYLVPSAFVLFVLGSLLLGLWQAWLLAPLALYLLLIFLDATVQNKSLFLGGFAVVTSLIQMFGYGLGFLNAFRQKLTSGRDRFLKKMLD